jgi:predicted methyltransferase
VSATKLEDAMRLSRLGALCCALIGAAIGSASPAAAQGAYAAAIADPGRPAADTARDAARKPAEMLAFAEVHPGETVLEVLPGGGYFTRLLSKAVGPTGHVYAATLPSLAKPVTALAADPAYANVTVVGIDAAGLAAVPPVGLIFTAQNYHDMHLTRAHLDVPAMDKLWYDKLAPGGYLVVIDHVAAAGAPVTATADTLHRIDPAAVRQELEAAGFVFDGGSDAIRNPADPHDKNVFDPSIRGHTDQFVFRFKRP